MSNDDRGLKLDRKRCHQARDEFLRCYDTQLDSGKNEEQASNVCRAAKLAFDGACPVSWVNHFIRKHNFDRYKKQLQEQGVNIADKKVLDEERTRNTGHARKSLDTVQSFHKFVDNVIGRDKPDVALLSLDESTTLADHNLSAATIEKQQQSTKTSQSILDSLRLSHEFTMAAGILAAAKEPLTLGSLLAAARLLGLAGLRMVKGVETKHVTGLVSSEQHRLLLENVQRLSSFPENELPPLLRTTRKTITAFMSIAEDAGRAITSYNRESLQGVVHRKELARCLACGALRLGMWQSEIMKDSEMCPNSSPYIVFELLRHMDTLTMVDRKVILEWYLENLSGSLLSHDTFENYSFRIFNKAGARMIEAEIDHFGNVRKRKGRTFLQIPEANPLSEEEVSSLRDKFYSTMETFTKSAGDLIGSVTRTELARLRNMVAAWREEDSTGKLLVVDFLNFRAKGSVLQRMLRDYNKLLLVTRKSASPEKYLFDARNIRVFECGNTSEDDLITIFAALEWGSEGFVLSNDQFRDHAKRIQHDRLSLNEWMSRRVLRFHTVTLEIEKAISYERKLTKLKTGIYYVPVMPPACRDVPIYKHFIVYIS